MNAAHLIDSFYEQRLPLCGLGCMTMAITFARLRGATATQVLVSSDSVCVARFGREQRDETIETKNRGNGNRAETLLGYHSVSPATVINALRG
jgi:hypothetical protein